MKAGTCEDSHFQSRVREINHPVSSTSPWGKPQPPPRHQQPLSQICTSGFAARRSQAPLLSLPNLPVRTTQQCGGGVAVSPHFDPLPQHTCKEPHSSSHSDAQALLSEGTLIMLVWVLQRNRTNRRKKYIYYIDREIDYIDYYMDYNMCVYTHI